MKPLIMLLAKLGLPLGAATALAVLLIEKTPMCLSELSRKTGYAKSHLSIYLRTLASKRLVEINRYGRRIYYRASNNALSRLLKEHFESIYLTLQYIKQSSSMSDELSRLLGDLENILKKLRNSEGGLKA